MVVFQRAYLLVPGDRAKRSSKKWLQESLTPPLTHPLCQVPPISSSSYLLAAAPGLALPPH